VVEELVQAPPTDEELRVLTDMSAAADLQALAEREDRHHTFTVRTTALRQTHARKPSLIERLNRAGM